MATTTQYEKSSQVTSSSDPKTDEGILPESKEAGTTEQERDDPNLVCTKPLSVIISILTLLLYR